ncbi:MULTISPECIES: glycoside hydrolase family 28 protein [Sphingobacterium]|uniref:glycoside hydrolase family 28 protein n=1 Tax=Sphingobacterium TaxID=28453 RepID=UPI00257F86BA|nr:MULTISPECIES: glycosyl hydrolase family 28 protein [Sphingobacterium]
MKIKLILVMILLYGGILTLQAKEYNASLFGIKSNGTTLNTTSIQRAIDFIHEQGGGTLRFYVGRYLTGTVVLKENVHIQLEEGAILVGSTNIYDYNIDVPNCALIYAKDAKNITIKGKGVIDGQGREVAYNLLAQIQSGVLKDPLDYDRPRNRRPKAIYMRSCENVRIHGVTIKNSADWVQVYDQCVNTVVDSITVDSKAFWNNDGIDIVDCRNFKLLNSFIDASDDAICLKSHDATKSCEDVEIRNCTARSSANGIKFGTVSAGGYKRIRIINNKVYDTFRSALTIATPDGGIVEDILVDSLTAFNTGNPFYLRIGARWNKERIGSINNVVIQNVKVEVAKEKPDRGYSYEGPIEDNPRNPSPSSIVGLKNAPIRNVTFRNIEISYPGGSNPHYAYRGTSRTDLDSIPEMEASYPEFSQFKELPAWGFYIRHAENIHFEGVVLKLRAPDYRPMLVLDDVNGYALSRVKQEGAKGKKELVAQGSKKNKP